MVKIGYMWQFTDDAMPLEEKLRLVINYYTQKVGKNPEFVVINDKTDSPEKYGNIDILHRKWIRKNYFWVGVYG